MAMEALRIAAKESKFMKFILGGFIFLAVGGLVFTDVGGYFTGGAGSRNVAKVGDTKVDIREFDSELRGFLQQTGLTTEDAYKTGLINAFLQGRVQNILKAQAAQDLDLVLDNQTIAKEIQKTFEGASKDQIAMTLRAQGLSEQQFANAVQSQVITRYVDQMPTAVTNYVPSYIADVNAKIQSEQRSGTLYTVSLKSLANDIEITDADIMNYYQSNQAQFTVAEERIFTIGKMTLDMAKSNIPAITDADVRAQYDDNPDDFRVPETRAIEQAVVKDADEAQAIYELALEGTSLKEALGDKGTYRAQVNYQQDALPVGLADAAFASSINKGDITAPVKTALGYTIMAVNDVEPETIKSFDTVKSDLKKQLQEQAIYDSLYNKIINTEDLIDNGESFASIAEKTGLKTTKTKSLSRAQILDATGDLKTAIDLNPSIIDEIYTMSADGASYPLELDDESYIVIGIDTLKPQTVLPLDDVKSDITKTIKANIIENQATIALAQMVDDLNAGTKSTSDIKGTSKSFKNLKTDTESANKDLIFGTSINEFDYRIDGDNAIIATITDVNFDNTDIKQDRNQIVASQRQIIDSLLMQYYRNNTSISINERLLSQAYSGVSE